MLVLWPLRWLKIGKKASRTHHLSLMILMYDGQEHKIKNRRNITAVSSYKYN
ncbi:hypothetical protein J14TS5_04170 [Paenibacillus lautus]|nr:hypothetical protein J14TS5_04170 [Paenibacillus lautus]